MFKVIFGRIYFTFYLFDIYAEHLFDSLNLGCSPDEMYQKEVKLQ